MNKVLLSLCLCLALISLPCSSYAEDGLTWTKPGRVLTTTLLGLSFGMIVGGIIVGVSGSSTAAPFFISAGVGAALGFMLAVLTPTEAVEEANTPPFQGAGTLPLPRNLPPGDAPRLDQAVPPGI